MSLLITFGGDFSQTIEWVNRPSWSPFHGSVAYFMVLSVVIFVFFSLEWDVFHPENKQLV